MIGGVVDTCLEVYTIDIPVVPPVPGHLTRLYPRPVALVCWGGETPSEVTLCQLLILRSDDDASPREYLRVFSNDLLTCLHLSLQVVVSALLCLVRYWGKDPLQRTVPFRVIEEHTRIVQQIRLHHTEFDTIGSIYGDGEECQTFLVPLAQGLMVVLCLEAVVELTLQGLCVLVDVRNISLPVLREREGGLLIFHSDSLLGDETPSYAIVVGSETETEITGLQGQFLINILHATALKDSSLIGIADFPLGGTEGSTRSPHLSIGKGQTDLRRCDQQDIVALNAIGQLRTILHRDGHMSIR